MIDDTTGDDAFAESIAVPLRRKERADDTFEARAMSAVIAESRAALAGDLTPKRSWWLRPRIFEMRPLTALAWAAGLVLIVGGSWVLPKQPAASSIAAQSDTVHVVRFVFLDSSARRVELVGAFNQWQKGATVLAATGTPGVWEVSVPLVRGRHEYAFIVTDERGDRWVADPLSQPVRDDFGTESSVISVGTGSSS